MLEKNSLRNSKNPDLIEIKLYDKLNYDKQNYLHQKKQSFFEEKL